jgi:hypothetical protein
MGVGADGSDITINVTGVSIAIMALGFVDGAADSLAMLGPVVSVVSIARDAEIRSARCWSNSTHAGMRHGSCADCSSAWDLTDRSSIIYRARNPPCGTFRSILKIRTIFRVVEIEKFSL